VKVGITILTTGYNIRLLGFNRTFLIVSDTTLRRVSSNGWTPTSVGEDDNYICESYQRTPIKVSSSAEKSKLRTSGLMGAYLSDKNFILRSITVSKIMKTAHGCC
jgi:hypothetical protein